MDQITKLQKELKHMVVLSPGPYLTYETECANKLARKFKELNYKSTDDIAFSIHILLKQEQQGKEPDYEETAKYLLGEIDEDGNPITENIISDFGKYVSVKENIDWNKMKKDSENMADKSNDEHIAIMTEKYKEQQENIKTAYKLFKEYLGPLFEDLIYKTVMEEAKENKKMDDIKKLTIRLYTLDEIPSEITFFNVKTKTDRIFEFNSNKNDVYDLLPMKNEVAYNSISSNVILNDHFRYHYHEDLEYKDIDIDDDSIKDFSPDDFEYKITLSPTYLLPTIDWCNENGIDYRTYIDPKTCSSIRFIIDNDLINDIIKDQ